MAAPLQHVGIGDPIPRDRETWNAMIDAGRAARGLSGTGAGVGPSGVLPSLTVFLRNDTGAPLPVFSVLAIGAPIVSPADAPHEAAITPAFAGAAPATADDVFGILTEPIDEDATGRAIVRGLAVCDLVVNSASHEYAAPADGVTATLSSAESGSARILWKAGGSGTVRAVVLLGATPPPTLFAVATTTATGPYYALSDLMFDFNDGFRLSIEGGKNRLDLNPANYVAPNFYGRGIVDEGSQSWLGRKTFVTGVSAGGVECPGPVGGTFSSTGGARFGRTSAGGDPYYAHFGVAKVGDVVFLGTGDAAVGGVPIAATGFGISAAGESFTPGVTGTLAPGATVTGGIIVSVGSGSYGDVLSSGNNTLTGVNMFVAPNAGSIPLTVRGAASQSANLFVIENSSGTDLLTVSASGVVGGNGGGLTNLDASALATGTVPFARTAPDLLALAASYGG